MESLIKYINEQTNNAFTDLKISDVIFNRSTQTVTFKFVYKKDRQTLTEQERELLNKLAKDFLNLNVKIEVKTKKALIDEDVVKIVVLKFVYNNYSAMANSLSQDNIFVDINGNDVTVNIEVASTFYDFVVNKNFEQELLLWLQDNFFEDFTVTLTKTEDQSLSKDLENRIKKVSQSLTEPETPKYLNVSNVTEVVGDFKEEKAHLISAINSPVSGVAIAGKLKFINKRSFTSKRKDAEGNFIQKEYYSFTIMHNSKSMPCVMFLSSGDFEKFETLNEDDFIIAFGDVEKFNDKLNFKVKKISQCIPQETPQQEIAQKNENEDYIFVAPQDYVMLEQSNLFNLNNTQVNKFLSNNEVVVFDLETTGLEASSEEIIEIGAVKIINGKLTQTFSSLIKPNKVISEEITGITGITNEMVADAYSIEQVLPDFYKFTRGAVLSAYNIAFDYNFLYVASHKMGYNFNNRQIDSMYLARTKLPGLKNYRLKTVATTLGVPLENAHRAVNDAIATAEVFIKLSDDLI